VQSADSKGVPFQKKYYKIYYLCLLEVNFLCRIALRSIRSGLLLPLQRGLVPLHVGLLVTTVSCAKTAEPIEMPLGV